jgi:hypothetical protein
MIWLLPPKANLSRRCLIHVKAAVLRCDMMRAPPVAAGGRSMSIETIFARPSDVPALYSLVREDFPDLTADAWESYAAPYVDELLHGGLAGIVAARATMSNSFRGLFLYSVETTLRHPRTLVVPYTVLPPAFGGDLIADLFVNCWRELAEQHECGLVKLTLEPAIADDLVATLGVDAAIEAVCLCLTLPTAVSRQPRRWSYGDGHA